MKKQYRILYLSILFCSLIGLGLTGSAISKEKKRLFSGEESASQIFDKCSELYSKKKFQDAVDCLEIFKSRYPESPLAQEAEMKIADTYFAKKDYLLAAESYHLYVKVHPNGPKLDYAYYKIGLSYLKLVPKAKGRNQEHLPAAIDTFKLLLKQYPDSEWAKQGEELYKGALKKVAERHFSIGRFYYKQGEYRAAAPRFEEVFNRYAGLGLDEEALYYAWMSYHKLQKPEEAAQVLAKMEGSFPDSSKTKVVLKKAKNSDS